MTLFGWGVVGAAAIALAGSVWRAVAWRRGTELDAGVEACAGARGDREAPVFVGAIGSVARALLDLGGQRRLWRADPVRGAAHLVVVAGFTGLVLLHAFGDFFAGLFGASYLPTVSPWWGIRDLCGVGVLAGLAIGIVRRRQQRGALPTPRRRDPIFLAGLALLVASGFGLAALKITSAPAFARMVQAYASVTEDEAAALRVYWGADYGVIFPPPPSAAAPGAAAAGEAIHQAACAACHSRPQQAIVSYGVSRLVGGVAPQLVAWGAEAGLLQLHQLLCVFLLAYFPFSRFFHVVTAPVALLSSGAPGTASGPRRWRFTLDACLRCGLCDEHCSVAPLAHVFGNARVLPAAKLDGLRAVSQRTTRDASALAHLAEGAYACTACGRCTARCPIGLPLEALWAAGAADLRRRGEPPAPEWIKATPAAEWADRLATTFPGDNPAMPRYTNFAADRQTFAPCVQCQTCTNVCPVVAHAGGASALDATPQRVMNLLRLGLMELALGSRMVWDCATCYQCQESCPAGIPVTEILYELRNRGYDRLGRLPRPGHVAVPGGRAR